MTEDQTLTDHGAGAPRPRRSRFVDRAFRGSTAAIGAGLIVLLGFLLLELFTGGWKCPYTDRRRPSS